MSQIKEVTVEVAEVFVKKFSLGQTVEAPMIEILVPSVMDKSLACPQLPQTSHPYKLEAGEQSRGHL